MDPLDFPDEDKPVNPKPILADDKQLAFLSSPFGNLLVGAATAGFSALVIIAGDPGSTDIPFSFFSFFIGVAFICVGIFRLLREGLVKRGKRGHEPPL